MNFPPKKITCPSDKLRTEFTSPTAKSTSPILSDTTFFACWEGKTGVPRAKPLRTIERANNKLNLHIWYPGWDLNLGNIGERRVSSPLCHPCSSWELSNQLRYSTFAKIFQVSSVKRKVNSCWVFISPKRFLILCLHDQCMHIQCNNFVSQLLYIPSCKHTSHPIRAYVPVVSLCMFLTFHFMES